MIVVTTESVPGRKSAKSWISCRAARCARVALGETSGRATQIVGGEVHEYAELLTTARAEAMNRMVAEAEKLGADAVVQVRYNTADVMQGTAELLAYGTAVRLKS